MAKPTSFLISLLIAAALAWSFGSLASRAPAPHGLEVWMLNVGQGESVLLREETGKKLLFDGGPDDSVLSQLGSVLPPWDRTIDLVILSHDHSDHVDGLISVLERYRVGEVWISGALEDSADYREFRAAVDRGHVPVRITYFDAGACSPTVCPAAVPFGSLSLQVYHPIGSMDGVTPKDQHDATVVVKATYGNRSVLLTGDLNEGHEEDMLHACRAPCSLAATILQVPHHGSSSGLAPEFLAAVHPAAALIPVGLHNSYGHPAPGILKKLRDAGITYYRTDTQGRISAVLDADGYSASTER